MATAEQRKGPSLVPVAPEDVRIGAYLTRNDQPGEPLYLFEVADVEEGESVGRYVWLLSVSEPLDSKPLRLTVSWLCGHYWLERRAPEPEAFDWR